MPKVSMLILVGVPMNSFSKVLIAAAASVSTALLASDPATAHHSYAMFDKDKEDSSSALVRTWEFTSPHATLWVYINDAEGKPRLWALEAPGPSALVRSGWDKNTVKPGDKVTVVINPLRDGRNGGSLVKLVLADGRTMNVGAPTAPGTAVEKAP